MKVVRARIATVTSPVFWGSFIGILLSAIVAGLSYIQITGTTSQQLQPSKNGYIVVFLCLLCVRYYASIVFLTYKDALTPEIRGLEAPARRTVFWIQLLLIVGCSASASLLSVFGVAAACFVVICQGLMMICYWRIVWSLVIKEDPRWDRHIIMFIVDIAILGSAVFYFLLETGVLESERGTAGLLLGAVFMGFIAECAICYFRAIKAFIRETRDSLKGAVLEQMEAGI